MDAWLIPLARGTHVGAMLLVFGSLIFRAAIGARSRGGNSLIWAGLGVSVAAGAVWLVAEAADMAWADSAAEIVSAVPAVATATHFGRLLLLRLALLVAAAFCAGRLGNAWRVVTAAMVAGLAVAIQAWTGHAAAASDGGIAWLAVTESVHLLAAGAWLGALPALLLAVSRATPEDARRMAVRFTWLGVPAVLTLAATGMMQADQLIGGVPALLGTAYGRIATLKIGLFVALVILAALNRFSWLARPKALRASIATETLLGALVIMAAAWLASGLPGTHATPVWPFPSRLTWQAFADPTAWEGVSLGIAGSTAALVLAGWSLARRRVGGFATGIILAVLSLPHLGPLLTEAYPTSFARSPTGFSAESIVAGAGLFATHCAACHGATGAGDGAAAASLPLAPADLRAPHLLAHTEGDLFWFIGTGFSAPGGGVAMPGFAAVLPEDARWNLVDFLLAQNAGARFGADGTWRPAVRAPGFPIACGRETMTLADLQGRPVRLVLGSAVPESPDARIVLMHARDGDGESCVAAARDVSGAYAVLIGATPEAEFLVDARGWLRAYWKPANADELRARLSSVGAAPIAEPSMPSGHRH